MWWEVSYIRKYVSEVLFTTIPHSIVYNHGSSLAYQGTVIIMTS